MEVSTKPEVYDIDQILSSQNASNLSDHQKYLTLNKQCRSLNEKMLYMGVTEAANPITNQTICHAPVRTLKILGKIFWKSTFPKTNGVEKTMICSIRKYEGDL